MGKVGLVVMEVMVGLVEMVEEMGQACHSPQDMKAAS
jgi:hypothetical protein